MSQSGAPGLARYSACVSPVQMVSRQAWAGAQGVLLPSCPATAEGRLDRAACLPCNAAFQTNNSMPEEKNREPKNGIESQLGPSMLLSRCIYDNALLLNSPEECVIFKLYFSSSLSHSHISSSSLLSCPVFVPFVFLLRKESLLYEQVCEMPGGCGDPQMVRVVPTQ